MDAFDPEQTGIHDRKHYLPATSLASGNIVTLPDGVELDGVFLGLTDHLGDHRQVRHLHGGPAELEDDDEESVVGEQGHHTAVGRTQQAVDQQ